MGIFSRKKKEKKEENLGWKENQAYVEQANEEQAYESSIYEAPASTRGSASKLPLSELYGELYSSKKSGFFKKNSDEYNSVSDALVNTLDKLASPLDKDNQKAVKTAAAVRDSFENLIKKCDQYLNRKDSRFVDLHGRSKKGSARQDIVNRIRTQAMDDFQKLTVYFGEFQVLPDSEKASSVWEALGTVRRKRFRMNQEDSKYNHVGGASSRLTVLKKGDLDDLDASGFFKETEIVMKYDDKLSKVYEIMEQCYEQCKPPRPFYEMCKDYMRKNYPINDLDKDSFYVACGSKLEKIPGISTAKTYKYVNAVSKSLKALYDLTNNVEKTYLGLDLSDGKSVNLTNRNVATSRVAELLGIGDVVAKSETVEMIEPGQKNGRIGNLMQAAKGTEGKAYLNQNINEIKEHALSSDITTARKKYGLANKVSGNFQRQMMNLQVLDYITGQQDRHAGNYFVQEDENGMLTGVTGIDNDYSFGQYRQNDKDNGVGHGRSLVNKNADKFVIPHMDANLAERIKNISKDQFVFLLGDLLDNNSIDLAWGRLSNVQRLLKEKETGPKDHFLLQDNEWNADTLKEFFTEDESIYADNTTYLQYMFLYNNYSTSENKVNAYKKNKEKNAIWKHFIKENHLNSSEKIADFIVSLIKKSHSHAEYDTSAYEIGQTLAAGQDGLLDPDIPYYEYPTYFTGKIDIFLKQLAPEA